MIDEPVDEIKLMRQSERGTRAQMLIKDEMLQEAFKKVGDALTEQWRMCKTQEGRERIWIATGLLEQTRQVLYSTIEDGKVAKAHLAMIERRRGRARAA